MIPLLLALACSTPAPPPAPPAPPPPPPEPELRATASGPCWVMPLPVALGLKLAPDGRALVSAKDGEAGRDRHQSWWVDLDTGLLEPLGDGLGPLPQVLNDGSVLLSRPEALAPDTQLRSVRVGPRPEQAPRLMRLKDGVETALSTPGHDLTSFLPLEEADALLYVAGRKLWRVPLSGGEPEALADEVLDIHAVLEDGRWLVNMAHENKLVLALLSPEGEVSPLGEGVDLALIADGQLWAQSHARAPLWRGPVEGPVSASTPGQPRRLLPSGAEAVSEEGGVRLQLIGAEGEGLRVQGADGLRDAQRQGERVVALVGFDTHAQGSLTPMSEADLCVLPAAGAVEVPSRDVPFRYVERFTDLEALSAELKAKVSAYKVRGVDGLVELTLEGPGPIRPPSLRELVDRAQAAMPSPTPDLLLRFPTSGRFGLVMTRADHMLHRAGYEDVVLVAEAKEVPLHIEDFREADEHCLGEVRNAGDAPLSVVVECAPQGGGWGHIGAPPSNTQVKLELGPGDSAEVKVRAPFAERAHTLRFQAGDAYVPFLLVEDALAARQLNASLLDLSERRQLRVVPDRGPGLTFSVGEGPWVTDRLPGVHADALLIELPEGMMEDEAAMKAFTRDLAVAFPEDQESLPSVRLATPEGQLYKRQGEGWAPDGRRPMGLGGLQELR